MGICNMLELAPGVFVKLFGGHEVIMTVAEVIDNRALCVWFDDNDKFFKAYFLVEYLELC